MQGQHPGLPNSAGCAQEWTTLATESGTKGTAEQRKTRVWPSRSGSRRHHRRQRRLRCRMRRCRLPSSRGSMRLVVVVIVVLILLLHPPPSPLLLLLLLLLMQLLLLW